MKRLKLWLAGLSFLGIMFLPAAASADVNNFTVTSFAAAETLSRSDPHGELHIIERINVTYTDYNHGILRAIPASYKGYSLKLHVNSVTSDTHAPSQYTTYDSNGNTVLKIGDPNQTVTGQQEYNIDYTLHNVISFYNDHDELYWDVNGDQWQQPFESVSATVHLPPDLKQIKQPICYSGSFGSTAQNCTVFSIPDGFSVTSKEPLTANQTLTYVAGFQKGYFQPPKWYDQPWVAFAVKLLVPFLVIGGGSWLYWLKRGRDPKGTGVIVPQYDAPDGLKPAEVGTIIDFKLDNTDITATIIDLAVHGYLKIIETKHNKLLRRDTLSYNFELVNPDLASLDPNEQEVMNALFSDKTPGATIDMSALKNKLYTTAKTLSSNVEAKLTADGYFRSNPLSAGKTIGYTAAILLGAIYIAGRYIGLATSIGIALGAAIAAICATKLAARTAKGVAAKEHALGLKMYMEFAEKDRIAKLQSPDAPYAANAGEPVKTVDLFEKLLPYAMVLGVEKQWAKQFEGLYISPPTWYAGNWTTFNAFYLAGSLSDGMNAAVNTAFSAPSSGGSSGFGGGFSGGGGGGGGGGGW